MKDLKFKVGKVIEEKDYHIFKVQSVEKINPKGEVSNFTKLKAPDWVGAIVQVGNHYLCTKEYRHGVDKVIYQFPCGTVEEGESSLDCCLRELNEELGIRSDDITSINDLYTGCPNPAFMDNKMTFYLVKLRADVTYDTQKLDKNEFIHPVLLNDIQVEDWLKEPDAGIQFQNAWRAKKEL